MELKVTNIEDLKKLAQGEVIQLPKFSQEIPFNARVKRVSLLNLVRKGVVPNKLLSAAEELFYGKQSSKENVDLAQMTNVMYIMAENALVEPSIDELKNIGLELTDEQIVALFNYTQEGISELDSFREESENTEYNINK